MRQADPHPDPLPGGEGETRFASLLPWEEDAMRFTLSLRERAGVRVERRSTGGRR
jgi:hypothetical protein